MGFRTVVMLSNDMCHNWSKDPELGSKIHKAMSMWPSRNDRWDTRVGNYGAVVEVVHADTQTIAFLDHYQGFEALGYGGRTFGPTTEEDKVEVLKRAAEKMGYRLVKKAKKNAN